MSGSSRLFPAASFENGKLIEKLCKYVDSITFANTLNFPLAGTTTWDLETATWASTSSSWGYTPPVTLAVSANITQVMLSSLNAEDVEKIASALMPTDLGVSATVTLVMPVSGTLANEQDMKFNINFFK